MTPEHVENERGVGFRNESGFVYYYRHEADKRYARLLAQSPFARRPQFMSPELDGDKLVLESSGRRVTVEPETWEGLQNALVRIHFQQAPPKVPRISGSIR